MKIPNYDSSDDSDKKFKQLYPYMPSDTIRMSSDTIRMSSDTIRMLICGNSGSGKANLLYHMLIKPPLYYHEIYPYARNLEQQ